MDLPRRFARHRALALPAVLAWLLSACAGAPTAPTAAAPRASAGAGLLERLRPLCGQAYEGRIVADTPASANDPFAGQRLVMHVRDCAPDRIAVPFHVGEDRSRTWVFSRQGEGLRFKHDHRHRDGSADALTQYGGDQRTADRASGSGRYEFPADAESQAMFRRLGREVSVPNVWAVEIDGQRMVYELARPGRLFRVEFDLARPVPAPPAPWGG